MTIENYITGKNGFLGGRLADRLKNFTAIPHEEILNFDIKPFSHFFFLSAYGNMSFQTEDNKIIQANLLDLLTTIQKASAHDFDSFLYMSTSSVKLPIQTMYSRTKEAAEKVLLAFMEKYNLPISIVRPFSITGVGEQEKHLIPTLIRSCLFGERMDFVPGPAHDFIDVEDVIDGMLVLSKVKARGIFELGSGKDITNETIKEIVERITGKKANLNYVGRMRNYDNDTWVSRNNRVRDFGWSPKKSLEQSITEMVKSYATKN